MVYNHSILSIFSVFNSIQSYASKSAKRDQAKRHLIKNKNQITEHILLSNKHIKWILIK